MDRRKKRWLLGCGCGGVALSMLGVLALFVWPLVWARMKPGPVVEVVTYYPGMSASVIEKTITNRIERWVNQAPGAQVVTSRSLAGVSIVRVYFRNDIDPNGALTMTSQLALGTLPTLPPNTLPPVVLPRDPLASEPLGMLAVRSSMMDEMKLRELAQVPIREWFTIISGAVVPVVLGGKERTILINLKPAEMEVRHLTATDVVAAIKKSNMAPGIAYFGDNQLLLDSNMMADNIVELLDLPIRMEPGNNVFLRDIGVVQDHSAAPTVQFRIDGHPAVGVPVYLQSGAPLEDVRANITRELPSIQDKIPPGAQLRWAPLAAEHKWLRERDDGLLKIYLRAPSNSRLAETEKRLAAVEDLLQKSIPTAEREAIVSQVGMTLDWSAVLTVNAGPMDATIFVQLSRDRTLSAAEYAVKLRRALNDDPQFADLGFRFVSRDMPPPVDIRISGRTLAEMTRVAKAIRSQLAAIKGTADVDIAQRMDAPFLVITADAEKAAAVGLSSQDVLTQCLAALRARAPLDRDFWINRKDIGHTIAIPFSTEGKVDDALQREATGKNLKQPVKLSSLATLQRTTSAVEIDHVDLQRVLDVRANIAERKRGEVIADIRKMIQELSVPQGMKVELANDK
ncbi:MAG: efflux RND transporter permease subunit [Gemmataceae bacterium]